jgi:hypothetical protein
MKRPILTALAAAAVLTLAGCGSSTSTEPTTTTVAKLTKAQLIEKADKICVDYKARSKKEIPEPKSAADLGDYLDKNLALAKEQFAAIKALGEPSDDAATYKAAIDAQTKALDALDKKIPELKKNPESIGDDTEIKALTDASDKAASAFGFKECGKTSSSSDETTTTTA